MPDQLDTETAVPVKTLQECKDEVAKSRSYNDWDQLKSGFTSYDGLQFVENRFNEAAEMYANQPKASVKVVTDEDIQNYVTSAHPDTIGNKPLQILMREKIRISLEWMRKQLTGE